MIENLIETIRGEIQQIVAEEMTKQIYQVNHVAPEEKKERLLTTVEACSFLRCSKPTLHRWKKMGIIGHVRIGTNIRYRESDIQKILSQH